MYTGLPGRVCLVCASGWGAKIEIRCTPKSKLLPLELSCLEAPVGKAPRCLGETAAVAIGVHGSVQTHTARHTFQSSLENKRRVDKQKIRIYLCSVPLFW